MIRWLILRRSILLTKVSIVTFFCKLSHDLVILTFKFIVKANFLRKIRMFEKINFLVHREFYCAENVLHFLFRFYALYYNSIWRNVARFTNYIPTVFVVKVRKFYFLVTWYRCALQIVQAFSVHEFGLCYFQSLRF